MQLTTIRKERGAEIDGFIICGDLNAQPDSWTVKTILGWKLDLNALPDSAAKEHMKKDAERYKHEIAFSSAYEQYRPRLEGRPLADRLSIEDKAKNHPPYTNYTPDWHVTLDYIFHSDTYLVFYGL